MLGEHKLKILFELLGNSSQEELIWIHGYLSGLISKNVTQTDVVAEKVSVSKPLVNKITIAYGTETGNSKKLASEFATKAKKSGINAKLVSLDQYRLNDLAKEEYFLTVISTQGDGGPPAAAKKFYDHIHQNGFNLTKLKFGVLALGDTSYPLFCKTGEDVDIQLSKLGGERIIDLQKCDTDYEEDAGNWFTQVLQKLSENVHSDKPASVKPPTVKKTSGKKIYRGTILSNIILNDRGSNKQTHHIEIAAEDVDYKPGDSIGIVPENRFLDVDNIFRATGIAPDKKFTYRNETGFLYDILKKKANIVFLADRIVKKYASIVQQDIPQTKIGLYDLLKIYPLKDKEQFSEVLNILDPIAPRLYSISSSPEAHSGEVHITVALDKFFVNDECKNGLCSDVLSQWPIKSSIDFYIHHNDMFRLPEDDRDVIMIGPGTGIAPFRSFIAHRDATGANGRNWLFFGDQHFTEDFLYQSEIQNWFQTGVLTNIHVAFSRDRKEKVYVQHKMLKHAKELYEWLENGAHLYLCGAKDPMSIDVENTLLQIFSEQGGHANGQAEEYLNKLKEEGRYLKDVY